MKHRQDLLGHAPPGCVYAAAEKLVELCGMCSLPGTQVCKECGPRPDVVLCDATAATIKLHPSEKRLFEKEMVTTAEKVACLDTAGCVAFRCHAF